MADRERSRAEHLLPWRWDGTAFVDRRAAAMLIMAAAIGVLAGLAAFGLRWAINGVQYLTLGQWAELGLGSTGEAVSGWRYFLGPAIGGLLAGPVIYLWAREARGHGVPEIMKAVHLERGVIRAPVAFVKVLASSLTIGTGGSCGREGPIAQVGAGLGSLLGQRLGLEHSHLRVLTASGAAAGIAAAFNAPIAGAFFALEIILGNFAVDHFGPVVVASVSATVLSHGLVGKAPAFDLTQAPYSLVHPAELLAYVALGLVAALVAVVFIRVLVFSEDAFERAPIPVWLLPAVGGLGVGALAVAGLPEVMGSGNGVVEEVLRGDLEVGTGLLLLLLGAKVVATCLTLGSGGSGGVFMPSLYLGAAVGTVVGQGAQLVFPFEIAPPGAYALVGMAAVASGTTHAPITMGIMLFELTGDHWIIPPLLVSASIAAIVARGLLPDSIYTHKLSRSGVEINVGHEALLMHELRVDDVMRTRHEVEVVGPSAALPDVLRRLLRVRTTQVYVLSEGDTYEGLIDLQDVKEALGMQRAEVAPIIAADVLRDDTAVLVPDLPLTEALETLYNSGLHELPVLDGTEGRGFLGTVSEHDILGVYNQEVLRKEALLARFVTRDDTEGEATGDLHTDYFELPEGYALALVRVPDAHVGRTLREAALRRDHQLNVLAIKERVDGEWVKRMPEPSRTLQADDLLVVMGPRPGIAALRAELAREAGETTPDGQAAPAAEADSAAGTRDEPEAGEPRS